MARPVLVATTDGVGTKAALAVALDRVAGLGVDLVHHCVNDALVQGARPLFFLDYFASGRLVPAQVAAFVTGCAEACRGVGAALLGGETAEMPGTYQDHAIDVVGTLVGVVDYDRRKGPHLVRPGDAILGVEAAGLHTNGFALARRLVDGLDLHAPVPDLGGALADALLTPHRCYLRAFEALDRAVPVHALAHITGGGLPENLPRALPADLRAVVDPRAWPVPPIFRWLQDRGALSDDELRAVFNLGVGLAVILPASAVDDALTALRDTGLPAWRIGEVQSGSGPRLGWVG